jgi:hypothetical protein
MQRILIKKYFLLTFGSVCRVKFFTNRPRNSLEDMRKSLMMPDQLRKWLRQQSKDLYAAVFYGLVKRWDKCIKVGGRYVEKFIFPGSNIICFTFYINL